MAKKVLATSFLLLFIYFAYLGGKPRSINSVMLLDYSDPDVCSDEKGFWITASSLSSCPGLPILLSYDLVNRTLVNNVLKRTLPAGRVSVLWHGTGVRAPRIRRHNGRYYIYCGDPDYGIFKGCMDMDYFNTEQTI
ncbi:MAG: family 43 glycosylhydrolase [Bacteroidales bacterium]|nr:family 43 glycosylhydrolase [Bacteroidales bacterium]MCI2122522.1 family 43 glycosylhydrolase [Bacteroidales bacterium]MCI2145287.1 family 43 glycosylhydrolase [Bacteroidales bacterium]